MHYTHHYRVLVSGSRSRITSQSQSQSQIRSRSRNTDIEKFLINSPGPHTQTHSHTIPKSKSKSKSKRKSKKIKIKKMFRISSWYHIYKSTQTHLISSYAIPSHPIHPLIHPIFYLNPTQLNSINSILFYPILFYSILFYPILSYPYHTHHRFQSPGISSIHIPHSHILKIAISVSLAKWYLSRLILSQLSSSPLFPPPSKVKRNAKLNLRDHFHSISTSIFIPMKIVSQIRVRVLRSLQVSIVPRKADACSIASLLIFTSPSP